MCRSLLRAAACSAILIALVPFPPAFAADDAPEAEVRRAEARVARETEIEQKAIALEAQAQAIRKDTVMAAKAETKKINKKFADLSFGVGLGLTGDLGASERVSDAIVDAGGIVRVNKKDNVRNRVMLESHYFFCKKNCEDGDELATLGWGPFMAIQPGDEEIVDAMGMGFMIGLRRASSRSGQSFNIGIGAVVDPSVKILGDEFAENQPAPVDGTGAPLSIRFQERDQWGWMVLFSFTWGEGDDAP